MRRSQCSATSSYAQREDEAMWRALLKQPGRQNADRDQHCKLPRAMPQDKARSSCSVDDEDQWSDVCKEDYRNVVQRVKELWLNWSGFSDDVTRESTVSHQSARPDVAGDSGAVFQPPDNDAVEGCSDQVDQIMARRDHQPGEGSVPAHDPLRDHAASALVVQNDKRVLAHAP